jgi:hypothetical protein
MNKKCGNCELSIPHTRRDEVVCQAPVPMWVRNADKLQEMIRKEDDDATYCDLWKYAIPACNWT